MSYPTPVESGFLPALGLIWKGLSAIGSVAVTAFTAKSIWDSFVSEDPDAELSAPIGDEVGAYVQRLDAAAAMAEKLNLPESVKTDLVARAAAASFTLTWFTPEATAKTMVLGVEQAVAIAAGKPALGPAAKALRAAITGQQPSSSATPWIIGGLAVIGLGLGAFVWSRKR